MSVYQRGGVYWFDFWFQGRRYRATTQQQLREDAELVESQFKLKLRREAGGIAVIDRRAAPHIQKWSEVYEASVRRSPHIRRPERIAILLRVVLRFWGAKPVKTALQRAGEPYHDLRLLDPILEPIWIERFEAWMAARGQSGQTRNQYRSVMSQMYKLAMAPAYRTMTGVQLNPFAGVPRDRSVERTVTLTLPELRAWIQHASYHIRLAIAIAALAPKLRLRNVLDLRWGEHIDTSLQRIVVELHKTAGHTGRPIVVPIGEQLRHVLLDAKHRRQSDYVVTYRRAHINSIRGGLKLAADRAGLDYGRAHGITFHTIRHTMATMMAELGEPESIRKELLGHELLETTQRYTHIRPLHQIAALERLSAATPIADLVTVPWRRARTQPVGTSVPGASENTEKAQQNTVTPKADAVGAKVRK